MSKRLTIDGNTKLGTSTGTFNVTPVKTCTPTEWCLRGMRGGKPLCYALRNNCRMRNVIASCKWRLEESLKQDFAERMSEEICKHRFEHFRIHALGDFYSAEYVRKWVGIVKSCPDTLFMSTTRRRDLIKPLKNLAKLPNIVVRESLDTDRTEPVMGFPVAGIGAIEMLLKAKFGPDFIECHGGCEDCGHTCWVDERSVIFPEH